LFLCLQPNNTLQWQSLPAKSTPSTLMSGPFAWMLSPVVAGVQCVDVAPGLERGPAVGSFAIQPLSKPGWAVTHASLPTLRSPSPVMLLITDLTTASSRPSAFELVHAAKLTSDAIHSIAVTVSLDGPTRVVTLRDKATSSPVVPLQTPVKLTDGMSQPKYGIELRIALPTLSVSVIDPSREELAVVWLDSVMTEVDIDINHVNVTTSVLNCRVDNQLPLAPHQVMFKRLDMDSDKPMIQVSLRAHLHHTMLRLIHFENLECQLEPVIVATDDEFLRRAYSTFIDARNEIERHQHKLSSTDARVALSPEEWLTATLQSVASWWKRTAAAQSLVKPLALFFSHVNMGDIHARLTFCRSPVLMAGNSLGVPVAVAIDAIGIMGTCSPLVCCVARRAWSLHGV
jgi:hypothetical protein